MAHSQWSDPLAMAMYGVALLPLINLVKDDMVTQKWYADDGNAVGSLESLVALHQKLQKHGPAFGYKLTKCNLIVKESSLEKAKKSFDSIDIEIVPGHRVLGSTIGSKAACDEFREKVTTEYQHQVEKLAIHARKSPQNLYHAFTRGIQNKLSFLSRTTPDMEPFLQETEKTISEKLLPVLTGKTTHTEEQRLLLSLPLKNGGLNILSPDDRAGDYSRSAALSECLNGMEPLAAENSQYKILREFKKQKLQNNNTKIEKLEEVLTEGELYAMKLSSEKGASSWLNALPLQKYGFALTKSEFRDGLALRYGWEPKNLPLSCACGEPFAMSHALHCAKGGYTHLRHNEIRDTFAKLLGDVCNDVEIEPKLQPLEGETFDNKSTSTEDEARLDIKANGLFDSRFCRTFFDVKIFNPFANSCPKQIQEAYKHHEASKKRKYEQRIINVEKSSFSPLVFATTGGAGPSASKIITRLAVKLSDITSEPYADVVSFIRTKVSFALLRSSILCIRGCRSLKRTIIQTESSMSAIVKEGRLSSSQ